MSRQLAEKDLAYEKIAASWSEFISRYDVNRRIEVLVEDFIGEGNIRGRSCLDGGCGLGFFTEAFLKHQPAKITAVDISPSLVSRLAGSQPKVDARTADLLDLESAVQDQFDVVLSSEVIEHTPDPEKAVDQLLKRVKPGGMVAISVPNRRWKWLLNLATRLGARPGYEGYENWVRPEELVSWIERRGFEIVRCEGVHFLPWQVFPKSVHRFIDNRLRKRNYRNAINLAVLARKTS